MAFSGFIWWLTEFCEWPPATREICIWRRWQRQLMRCDRDLYQSYTHTQYSRFDVCWKCTLQTMNYLLLIHFLLRSSILYMYYWGVLLGVLLKFLPDFVLKLHCIWKKSYCDLDYTNIYFGVVTYHFGDTSQCVL